MLLQVEDFAGKRDAQEIMQNTLKRSLTRQGKRNIGFPGGNVDEVIYSNGTGQLWCAFGSAQDAAIPRRWNAFGVFDPSRHAQIITVEINIPTTTNSARVAGFFARDPAAGKVYLMHDGSVGGGRSGIGRNAFLACSRSTLVDVFMSDGRMRPGVIIGEVKDDNFSSRLWRFVQVVRDFKEAVAGGRLDDAATRLAIAEWDKFRAEGSGRRTGRREQNIDYVSFHGDVVNLLHKEREEKRLIPNELVINTQLIDLCVKVGHEIIEIYEVKTGIDRQLLYTALGQLAVHSVGAADGVKRFLVIPEGEIPNDIQRSFDSLGIQVRRFAITGDLAPTVTLL